MTERAKRAYIVANFIVSQIFLTSGVSVVLEWLREFLSRSSSITVAVSHFIFAKKKIYPFNFTF